MYCIMVETPTRNLTIRDRGGVLTWTSIARGLVILHSIYNGVVVAVRELIEAYFIVVIVNGIMYRLLGLP
jgi:hypothetical protein